ncbi:Gfo/Idh/MocA family protein [Promethearchaeum syntrophicum]|uniref:Gfo/Idh/MocA family protein n=1 Tax=Promethearchaeum syntrophicum TaxID=2594042 RepID=A0A5B9D979_9ARCH|nr:Gfo/Idh/MocA family oxidoreductase [Candidatus Prometheoarchaeum syntrophicum]QEE15581.1 putative oxidoreductase [Candidatus Prometheoarchaeum syntrophicum]
MGNTKILRVGIVGCGRIFQSHNHAYNDLENVVVTGFYDRIKKRAQEWHNRMTEEMQLVKEVALEHEDENDERHLERCRIFEEESEVYENFQDLLNNVDVIDISTPNYAHAPYAIWALRQNKSVMSEKPPALCSLETQWICEAKEKSKAHYQINENFLWKVFVREIKKIIDNNVIGKINEINIKLGHGGPSWGWQENFLNPTISGGGVLSDMGSHALGFVFGILGHEYEIEKVQTIRMETSSKSEKIMRDLENKEEYLKERFMVEDEAEVKIKMINKDTKQEILIQIEVSWAKTYKEISVHGSKATCELGEDERKQNILIIKSENGKKQKIKIPGQGRDSHQMQITDFLSRIVKDQDSFANEKIAHKIQTIISASYLSNLLGFKSNKKKKEGKPITPDKLNKFYQDIIKSGCPKNIIIEEIIYHFVSPFIKSSE